jgi:hypothetical protein
MNLRAVRAYRACADPRLQSIARDHGDLGESARNHPPLFADALARKGAGI